jgi:hypothetical protein
MDTPATSSAAPTRIARIDVTVLLLVILDVVLKPFA